MITTLIKYSLIPLISVIIFLHAVIPHDHNSSIKNCEEEIKKVLIDNPLFYNDKLLINDSLSTFVLKGAYYLEN
mgnify:CR=1 FL=1